MTTAEKIKKYRLALGLSQDELGKQLGVEKNTIDTWESGQTDFIPISKIKLMSMLFKVTPLQFIEDKDILE